MLRQLSIRNIVLIDKADIALEKGLCVLTGETGAGKSILLDALGLALGMRADKGLVRSGAEQGSVSAEFDLSKNDEAKRILAELELPVSDELILRRTIASDGRTRCLANDEPISVTGLKKLGETLVEIHGQHDQRGLMDASTHLDLLDAYGELHKERRAVSEAYQALKSTREAIAALQAEIAQAQREEEFLRHMVGELNQLAPQVGEEEKLADARSTMMQGEKLADTLNSAMQELQGTRPVSASLRSAQRLLARSPASERFAAAIDMLDRAATEADEALDIMEKVGRDMAYSPSKLEQTEERLFALRAAARKYNMTADELATLRDQSAAKLATLDHQHDALTAREAEADAAREKYLAKAEALSRLRAKVAKQCETSVKTELTPLKMASTRFRVALTRLPDTEWSARGVDSARFEVATNAGTDFAPLSKIASGGELSRFMLAMKVVMAGTKSTPTMIFDEIDTGTGGAVADAIGARLAMLGDEVQVLVVTHLPQVAAKGDLHLRISKEEKKKATFTEVEALSETDRREELARMLSGATVTAEARKAAERLLETV